MAGPKKGVGSGTKVEISTDGTQFVKLMSVTKVTPPEFSSDEADVTDNESYASNDKFKESVPTFIDGGEIKIDGWVHTEDTGVSEAEKAFFDQSMVTCKVIAPAWIGNTITYKGFIKSLQPIGDLDPENGVPYSVTIKVTSKPVTTKTEART